MHHASAPSLSLSLWTTQAIDQECSPAYRQYEKARRQQYLEYFAKHPDLRCPQQPHSARSLAAALPPGWGEQLGPLIPRNAWHVHARSGKSSQTLAVALLGSATRLDPSLRWFWHAFDLPAPSSQQNPSFRFERSLPPSLLNEKPRATVLDFAVDDPGCFVAVETKWTEQGLGVCSCAPHNDGGPDTGGYCAPRVVSRKHYWQVAEELFGLPAGRLPLFGCPISPAYQAIRNVAAAQRLADGKRLFAFVMIYDAENPYFRATGTWPGWPAVLAEHLKRHEQIGFHFRATSWQELVRKLPLDGAVRRWAEEKHELKS